MIDRARGSMRSCALCLAFASGFAIAPPATHANDASVEPTTPPEDERLAAAREHFQKGVAAYDRADFDSAILEFQRAYALQPAYRLLYNLGQVNYELHDFAAAERHFRAYLADGGSEIPTARRVEVGQELERLRGQIAVLRLQTDRSGVHLFVDEHSVGWSPLDKPVHVNPGRRRIVAEHAGYAQLNKLVDVSAGQTLSVKLELGQPLAATGHHDQPTAAASTGTNWALWTGIATGAFALGAAGVGYWASRDANAYSTLIAGPTTRQDLDGLSARTEHEAIVADVLLGAAIVTGALTVVLLLTADRSAD